MRFFILLCAIMAWSVPARSQVHDKDFRLSKVEDVRVTLFDDVSGACWTNLKEVREYAEEKLRMKGAKVVSDRTYSAYASLNTYTLEIIVTGRRAYEDNSGFCIGSFDITLFTFAELNGLIHKAVIHNVGGLSTQLNLNRAAIELVSTFMADLK